MTDREVRYEIDSEGKSSGVELEDLYEASEDEIREPFDPRAIDVTTEARTLDTLIKRLEIGQIDLDPDFQRSRGIWTNRKKSQLIESLLLRIPLPTFYVAEIGESSGAHQEELGDTSWAVVDGIQRLSTITEFVSPAALGLEPLRLSGLEYLTQAEGKSFDELSQALQLRILESQFTIQVIRRSTPEAVKLNIFARINTGGVPLSAQELRHALIPGEARNYLKLLASSESFQDAVSGSVSPTRMADREMVLRYLAFRITDPVEYRLQDFDAFLRSSMQTINEWPDSERSGQRAEFNRVMKASTSIFGDDAFRKRYESSHSRRPVSKALFEGVAVAIATAASAHGNGGLKQLVNNGEKVKASFMELMADREFDRSVSQGTGDPPKVRLRFSRLIDLMDEFASPGSP